MSSNNPDRKVNTNIKTGHDQQNRLPNERDESPDQANPPRDIMKQAASDIKRGLVDTDRRATPGLEKVSPQKPQQAQPIDKIKPAGHSGD